MPRAPRPSRWPLPVAAAIAVGVHAVALPLMAGLLAPVEALRPAADLAVQAVEAPQRVEAGASPTLRLELANLGEVAVPAGVEVVIYGSTDRTLGEDDTALWRGALDAPLAPGASLTFDPVFAQREALAGPVVLIARADPAGVLDERLRLGNNTRSRAVFFATAEPGDPRPVRIEAPDKVAAGGWFEASVSLSNRGVGWAEPGLSLRLVLSEDASLDGEDFELTRRRLRRPIGPGESQTIGLGRVAVPRRFAESAHLLAVIEPGEPSGGGQAEPVVMSQAVRVLPATTPDLLVGEIDVGQLPDQDALAVSLRVANAGPAEAYTTPWVDAIYLSADRVWDEGDELLAESAWDAAVPPGGRYRHGPMTVKLPTANELAARGQAYLLAVTDRDNAVDEGPFEGNNTLAVKLETLRTSAEEIPIGSDQPELVKTKLAWIPYEAFEALRAPKRPTHQPVAQAAANPVPRERLRFDAGEPTPPSTAPPGARAPGEVVEDQPDADSLRISAADEATRRRDPEPIAARSAQPVEADADLAGGLDDAPQGPVVPDAPRLAQSGESPAPTPRPDPVPTETDGRAEPLTESQSEQPDLVDAPTDAQDTVTAAPRAAPNPADPAPLGAPPARPQPAPTAAPRSDREVVPTDPEQDASEVRPGQVLTGPGLEVKTAHPRFSAVARVSSLPVNPKASITFDPDGSVIAVELTRSSGAENIDGPVIASLYRWRATGQRLEKMDKPFTLEVTIRLTD